MDTESRKLRRAFLIQQELFEAGLMISLDWDMADVVVPARIERHVS